MKPARVTSSSGSMWSTMRFSAAHSGTAAGVPWNGVEVPFRINAGTPMRLPFSDPGLR